MATKSLRRRIVLSPAIQPPVVARCTCGEHCMMLARAARRGIEGNCPTCGRWRPVTTGHHA